MTITVGYMFEFYRLNACVLSVLYHALGGSWSIADAGLACEMFIVDIGVGKCWIEGCTCRGPVAVAVILSYVCSVLALKRIWNLRTNLCVCSQIWNY